MRMLLLLLPRCVFWRDEAEGLANQPLRQHSDPPPDDLVGGFFVFRAIFGTCRWKGKGRI